MKNNPDFVDEFEESDLGTELDDIEDEEPYADERSALDDDDDDDEDDDELSGLEGEELNMVEEGLSAAVLTSEQAMEVAGIRREELSINPDDHAIRQNEFQCEGCFLAKRISQRSSPDSRICVDCY